MFNSIFTDLIEGFLILAVLCGIYGFSNDVLAFAGKVQKDGQTAIFSSGWAVKL